MALNDQNEYTFNDAAYLAANPDVVSWINGQGDVSAWEHYQLYGKNQGRNALFDVTPTATDRTQWKPKVLNAEPYVDNSGQTYLVDPGTGDYYAAARKMGWDGDFQGYDLENAKLVASGQALNDQYINTLGLTTDPFKAQELYNLKQSNPSDYYGQIANKLEKQIYTNYGQNMDYTQAYNDLQSIKEIDPKAYYENQLKFLGHQVGWQIGQNRNDRNAPVYEEIKNLASEATRAGLSQDQINSIIKNSANEASIENQQFIANRAAAGNYWSENLMGALKVGAFALGAYGLDTALAAGAAAGAESAAAAGGAELAGPTYAELGYTGLEGGLAGPTYAELGYTGLNNAEAIAAADAASKGLTGSEALKYANQVRKGASFANTLSKFLTSGSGDGSVGGSGSGTSQQQIADYLRGLSKPVTNSFIGQIKANQNPFLFTPPGQTQAADGTYDVSGSNPMANALRKKDGTNS